MQVMGVKFDPTLNMGHILTIFVIVIGGYSAWKTLDARVGRLEERTADYVDIRDLTRTNNQIIAGLAKSSDKTSDSLSDITKTLGKAQQDLASIKTKLGIEAPR